MQDIKIAMIGGGFMGKAHSLAYSAMPMFFWPAPARPVKHVVVDATEDLARTAADRYGWNSSSSSWEAVINDPEVDLVEFDTNARHRLIFRTTEFRFITNRLCRAVSGRRQASLEDEVDVAVLLF